jgi:epoxyqueuosine reductase
MTNQTASYAQAIKDLAHRHGFMGAGIARAEYMDPEARRLEDWLGQNYHGQMGYMANHFDLRVDPTRLVPGAKSVISLIYNYYPNTSSPPLKRESEGVGAGGLPVEPRELLNPLKRTSAEHDHPPPLKGAGGLPVDTDMLQNTNEGTSEYKDHSASSRLTTDEENLKISRYAYGEDYHKVVRRKLKALVNDMKATIGDFHARVFVDSAPVLERDWARRSGLGWMGKNTMLIHPKKGSYFFLAEIILDVELEYDHPIRDHCGTCTKCIDACPTEAISPEGYVLDGSKCISYLTIEIKEKIPAEFQDKMEGWIFGCDICQEVCPWNRFSTPHTEPAFEMSTDLKEMSKRDWVELTEDAFNRLFEKSAVKRAGYEKLWSSIICMESKKRC